MAKYLEYWRSILKKIRKELDPAKPWPVSYMVNELEQLGEREGSGYNGYLRLWAGQVDARTASQVFADLEQGVMDDKTFLALCPGKAEFRITLNNTLTITHQPLTPDDFIERYKGLQGTEAAKAEVYKWKLVKANQDLWAQYARKELTFQQYFLKLDFANLVYPLARGVLMNVAKAVPEALEQIMLALYDDTKDLAGRLDTFSKAFEQLYFGLPDHGDNTFMEGRTMAALLTWRYPERYTIFKDSFYTPYCKALGIKPAKPGDKLPHYLDLVRALASEHIPRHPEVITARDAMLDATCYPDPNNMVLAQDILYMTTRTMADQEEDDQEVNDSSEAKFLKTLRSFQPEDQRNFLSDLVELTTHLGVAQGDERVVFHAVPQASRLGFTIGQAYCMQLGSSAGPTYGFALHQKGALPDVDYRREFKGANERDYAYTNDHQRVRDHWAEVLAFCQGELTRTDRSGHRAKNNPFLEKAVFDPAYRASILTGGPAVDAPGLIMVNITWNSQDWKGPTQDKSNHGFVKEGNTPMESWNFDLENARNPEGQVLGFVQHTAPPKLEGDNNLVVFHSTGKVVGFYGRGRFLKDKPRASDGNEYNIIGDRSLALVLPNKLDDIKSKGYLEDKQRMGQNGFIYLKEPGTVVRMIDEAIALNPDERPKLNALRAWVAGHTSTPTSQVQHKTMEHPLNTILYGPPGTGKTYHAITHAVAIVDGEDVEVVKRRPREQVRKRYDELLDKRLVRTVTFHQSFSYEDFIEGIKPQTHVSKDGEEEVKLVTYEVQDGIFKLMCASARTGEQGAAGIIDEDRLAKANFYKVSLGQYNDPADDEIYAYCMANNVIAVGYGGSVDVSKATDEAGIKDILKGAGFKEDGEGFRYTVSVLRTMHLDMKVGDIVLVSAGNSMVRAIGRVSGGYFMDENAPIRFKEFLKVDWLVKDAEIPVEDLYPKNLSMGTLYSLDRNLVKKDYFRRSNGTQQKRNERYVLIIDEINRGNVASIFGELITLIEDDKRDGGKEPAKVKLPYSKKEDFSVPSNLYILGTMNTADRSVEALDTALRRRFSFVEMASQAELVEPTVVGDVDLRALLRTINERVQQLMDKDHHIGHSYFMGLQTADDLKRMFATKVIPLLEEYFHGDAKKVGAILGEAFVEVRKKTIAFAKGFEMDEYEVKELYTVKDPRTFTDLEPFKAIYAGA